MLIRQNPGSSQTGSTKKLNLVLLLGGCLIVLAVMLAWFALERVQEKIKELDIIITPDYITRSTNC